MKVVAALMMALAGAHNEIRVSETRVCAYDPVRVDLEARVSEEESLRVGLLAEEGRVIMAKDVASETTTMRSFYDEALGPLGPAPRLTEMRWDPAELTLELRFASETNEAEVEWDSTPQFEAAERQWVDPKTLRLRPLSPSVVDRAVRSGSFRFAVRPETRPTKRSLTFRVARPAKYDVALLLRKRKEQEEERIVATTELTVEACGEEIVVLDDDDFSPRAAAAATGEKVQGAPPSSVPWFEVPGTLALTGTQALKVVDLPDEGNYPSKGGALSFKLYLSEGPTGTHRGLFFKGDPAHFGAQRTPSAWLLPDSNRVALRVSTKANVDVGADSTTDLPLRRWVPLVFVFDFPNNNYLLYVDGKLDANVTLVGDDPSLEYNEGPLFIGKDPERDGPRGMLADLAIWPSASNVPLVVDSTNLPTPPPPEAFFSSFEGKEDDDDQQDFGPLLLTESGGGGSGSGSSEENVFLERATNATEECASYEERLASYEAAALAGSVVGARRAAELALYGAERLPTGAKRCRKGGSIFFDDSGNKKKWLQDYSSSGESGGRRPQNEVEAFKSRKHLMFAAKAGDAASLRELALLGLSGVLTTTPPLNASSLLGLLHEAASKKDARAALALATRYELGWDTSVEASAWHARLAASVAEKEYHTPGEQTHVEMNLLSDATLGATETGQRGDDDEVLVAQRLKADKGDDPGAMVFIADLLYWGARGFERDHAAARDYFRKAASPPHSHVVAMGRYASMLIRGEGGPVNHSLAMAVYENAASLGSTVALNGLGYEYFFGHAVPANKTKAFGYFEEAARLDVDGDSNFNAAFMLHEGQGPSKDLERAAFYYERGASRHGHFDAALKLATLRSDGELRRDPHVARRYYAACARAGWLARDVRAGFDKYLQGRGQSALFFYAQASLLGFPVAAKNAAWLLDRRKVSGVSHDGDSTPFHQINLNLNFDADSANAVALDALKRGDCKTALAWYARHQGGTTALLATAELHARGQCLPRSRAVAEKLFRRAASLDTSLALRTTVVFNLAALYLDDLAISLFGIPIFWRRRNNGDPMPPPPGPSSSSSSSSSSEESENSALASGNGVLASQPTILQLLFHPSSPVPAILVAIACVYLSIRRVRITPLS